MDLILYVFLFLPSVQSDELLHKEGEGDEQREYEGEVENGRLGTPGERVQRSGVEEYSWAEG